jgi:SNF2 family DNA or RNA helicase
VVRKAVVVTPSSLTQNWADEARKWLGDERMRVSVLSSGPEGKQQASSSHNADRVKDPLLPCAAVVCGVSLPCSSMACCLPPSSTASLPPAWLAPASRQVLDFKVGAVCRVAAVSYETLRKHAADLAGCVDLLVCDEGHRWVLRSTAALP